jgi:hypothetical protein
MSQQLYFFIDPDDDGGLCEIATGLISELKVSRAGNWMDVFSAWSFPFPALNFHSTTTFEMTFTILHVPVSL